MKPRHQPDDEAIYRGAELHAGAKLRDRRFVLALAAYRRAVEHECRVHQKWKPRGEELRRLDEFHRTRVAWESASTCAEWLREEAADVLLAVARDSKPLGWDAFKHDAVQKRRERAVRTTLKMLDKIGASCKAIP